VLDSIIYYYFIYCIVAVSCHLVVVCGSSVWECEGTDIVEVYIRCVTVLLYIRRNRGILILLLCYIRKHRQLNCLGYDSFLFL
jgi:hypothetical protein